MSMRKLAALLAVVALGWPVAVQAQETEEQAQETEEKVDMAAMMEAYEKAGTPGEHHRALDRGVGEWDVEVKMYMDPSGEPTVSHATASSEWVMDGRFVQETVTGDFMDAPFRGMGYTGYNNVTGEYEASWLDNHSTQLYRYTGQMDDQGRLVMTSEYKDPVSGSMVTSRSVSEFVSDDEMVVRAFEDRGNGEVLTMELRYTKKN